MHNHPSGDATLSFEDKEMTEKLMKSGEELGITILDHFVVGRGEWGSWKENELQKN